LIALAKQLGRKDSASLLEQTLQEEKATDKKLTEIAEGRVNRKAAAPRGVAHDYLWRRGGKSRIGQQLASHRRVDLPAGWLTKQAHLRLCARYRRLSAAGKKLPVVVAAIAREMAAFLWAIGREVAAM
jgi:hypothetical protein